MDFDKFDNLSKRNVLRNIDMICFVLFYITFCSCYVAITTVVVTLVVDIFCLTQYIKKSYSVICSIKINIFLVNPK
jgi:hypothetical protein